MKLIFEKKEIQYVVGTNIFWLLNLEFISIHKESTFKVWFNSISSELYLNKEYSV